MNVELFEIKDKGDINRERIVLNVSKNTNIGNYIVFYTIKADENNFYTNSKQNIWFPDKMVNEGDLVVLYSKEGKSSTKKIKDGNNNTYFFYLGLNQPYFNNEKDIAVLIEINKWISK